MNSSRWAALTAILCILLLSAQARAERKKSDPGPHPLKVMKVVINNNRQGDLNNCKGDLTIWLQNVADVQVDKVRVDLELYGDNGRKIDTKTKEVGTIDPGVKHYLDFRWDELGTRSVTFKIWVYYNGAIENRLTQFEGEPPVW